MIIISGDFIIAVALWNVRAWDNGMFIVYTMCAPHTAKCCMIFSQDIIISNMSLLSDGVMPKELYALLFKQFVVDGIVSGIR